MIIPGRIYVESTIRIPVNFQDASGDDVDPSTVTFKLYSPSGQTTTYVFGADAQISQTSTGDYFVDVTPTEAGRWHFRWSSTGTNQNSAVEGQFVVQASPFFESYYEDAYRS